MKRKRDDEENKENMGEEVRGRTVVLYLVHEMQPRRQHLKHLKPQHGGLSEERLRVAERRTAPPSDTCDHLPA